MLRKLPYVLSLVLLLWSGTSHAQEAQVTGTMTMNTQQRLDKLEHQPQNAVVHTLGFHQLTPLNEIGGKAPQKITKPSATTSKLPAAATSKIPLKVYGTLVYSATWPNANGQGFYGVYSITPSVQNSITPVVKNSVFNFNGGAIYSNGLYNFLSYKAFYSYIMGYDYYQYDIHGWQQTKHVNGTTTHCMIVDGDYDATTGTNYAIMYDDKLQSEVFGTLDYTTNTREIIAPLDSNFVCFAINPEGAAYGVRHDGMLVSFDKNTGRYTTIGSTGVHPEYLQSAAFDPQSGTMYWAMCSTKDQIGLYTIDLSTGKATLVQAFPNNEEFSGLYIPAPEANDDAPAVVSNLSAHTKGSTLMARITFTLPKKTYAGDDLTGSLTYNIYVNGEVKKSGSAEAGKTVIDTVTVDSLGEYTFNVSAANAAGEGPKYVKTTKWVGYDYTKEPQNITLSKAGSNIFKLSWSAPTAAQHDGYFLTKELTYNITRYPGGVQVAQNFAGTTLNDTVAGDVMQNYYYKVAAVNHNLVGTEGESSHITTGDAVEVPYIENFNDLSVVPNMYTIIDSNNDGYTWKAGHWNSGEDNVYYETNQSKQANDWIITPPIKLKAGNFYRLSYTMNSSLLGTERFQTAWGNSNTVAGMQHILQPATTLESMNAVWYHHNVRADKDGKYYFGFHCISDADQLDLNLDSIRVESVGTAEAPDTVHNLVVTPAKLGKNEATLTFNLPTTNFNGDAIMAIDSVVIMRDGARIAAITDGKPGDSISYTDSSKPAGLVTYSVYTYNDKGCAIPAERTAWVGIDVPTVPTHLKVTENGSTATLTWKAPTTGIHGGYVYPPYLTYDIEDNNYYIKAQGRAGTTYSETRDASKQDLLYYLVSAHSTAGGSDHASSDTILFGNAYHLPFTESFANATTTHFWSQQQTGGQIGLTKSIFADNDNGAALFKPSAAGDVGMITSGKISLDGAQHPMLDFWYYALPGNQTTLSVGVVANDLKSKVDIVKNIDYSQLTGSSSWRKVSIDLSDYKRSTFILLSFIGTAQGSKVGDIAFDNINIHKKFDTDLSATLDVPTNVPVGETATAKVLVTNKGVKAVDSYTLKFYRDGTATDTIYGTTLAADSSKCFTFNIAPAVTSKAQNTYFAKVSATGDADATNNTTAHVKVSNIMPLYPVPANLKGTLASGKVNLQWDAPDMTQNNSVTEDFESYTPWIIDHIGRWITRDGDGKATASMTLSDNSTVIYDHVGEPMAWQVFNPSAVGLQTSFAPHSGKQMLFDITEGNNATADDWLISPRLSGHAQTITFWVRSFSSSNIESFDVMASASDTATTSFQKVTSSTAPADWTQISVNLPEGSRYFAIRVNAVQKFALMLDDVTYSPFTSNDLQLQGYNVYRNDKLVNPSPVQHAMYNEPYNLNERSYRVSAVYNLGESAATKAYSYTQADGITSARIDAPAGRELHYDALGRSLGNMQHGVNLIKYADGKVKKVVAK